MPTACRALWAQVIQQALDDVETLPIGSVDYETARDFLVGGGHWAESRRDIGEMLDLTERDIADLGRKRITARRAIEGLGPELEPVSIPKEAAQAPLPMLQATFPRPKVRAPLVDEAVPSGLKPAPDRAARLMAAGRVRPVPSGLIASPDRFARQIAALGRLPPMPGIPPRKRVAPAYRRNAKSS